MSGAIDHRIIVFGRNGSAREQLVIALSDYGVTPIWVGSPVQCSVETLNVLNLNQIVISLDPLIEDELEPFTEFLNQTSISVIYDDAESTQSLSGWDLKRWARHLAAKILDMDYMPPSPHQINTPTLDKSNDKVINMDSLNVTNKMVNALDMHDIQDYGTLEIDDNELNEAIEKLNQSLSNSLDSNAHENDLDFGQSIPSNLTIGLESVQTEVDFHSNSESVNSEDNTEIHPVDFNVTSELKNDDSLVFMNEEALSRALSNLDLQLAQSVVTPQVLSNIKLSLQNEDEYTKNTVANPDENNNLREYDLSKYKLVSEDDELNAIKNENRKYNHSHDVPLYLIISGIGGPGIVRSIFERINSNFSGILVLSQVIEASQLPKFMIQLQKVIPVKIGIADTDEYLLAGHIYLLPENHTIQSTALGYQCIKNSSLADFLIQKMEQNIEIVVLSGADASLAQTLIQMNQMLKNVHIQKPDECIDATLPQLLANTGAQTIKNEVFETWFN